MASPSSGVGWKIGIGFVAGAIFGAITVAQVAPNLTTSVAQTGPGTGPTTASSSGPLPTSSGGPLIPGTTPTSGSVLPPAPPGVTCAAGRNGGATDTGVTATQIKLATTVVRSGIGAAFLGDVQFAMEAVKNKVNRGGGICGRQLDIRYVDDGWDPNRGAGYIQNFIKAGVFAIPVGPSSEGLNVVVKNGDIKRAGIPVIGTDGMIISQYQDPWVWPVAVATAASARIMARNAYDRGARNFAIVFDKNYKFGVEAAQAFNNEVKRLTKQPVQGYNGENNCVQAYCGVLAGQGSYGTEVNEINNAYKDRNPNGFNFLAMFLEPQTALTWMNTPRSPTVDSRSNIVGIGLAQPLFTRDFAQGCKSKCHKMWVWTGYKPPIESYAKDPIVKTYVSDLAKTKPDADEFNAFAEGGYVGMQLLVDALKAVGPQLTRARIKTAIDGMRFSSGLTLQSSLSWPAAPRRFAASTMQAFEIQYAGTFGGWRAQSIAADPQPLLGTG
jgi:ABC-type branched-subunit amino acid transport system substrate-binding protein